MNRLVRGRESIRVEPPAIRVLACLAENRETILSEAEIIRRVWPDRRVTEGLLVRTISELHAALGEQTTGSSIIRTVPGQGYQLVGLVEWSLGTGIGGAPDPIRRATPQDGDEAGNGSRRAPRHPAPKGRDDRAGYPQEDDVHALLSDLRTGDSDDAWSKFIRRYGPVILQVVRLSNRDSESARDGFLFVCEQLAAHRFKRLLRYTPRQGATFATWLRSVVRNLCIDRQREVSGRKRLFEFVHRLSDLEQQVYRLYYLEGFTLDQTWQQLKSRFEQLTEGQVSTAVERVYSLLTPRQLWLLSRRGTSTANFSRECREADTGIPDPIGSNLTPEELLIQKEELQRLTSGILKLTVSERRLLSLRFGQGRSLQSCADDMGLENPQRVHRRLSAILTRLRVLIST